MKAMDKFRTVLVPLILLLAALLPPAHGAVPNTISYQGLLANSSTGEWVPDNAYNLHFFLYTVSSGGSSVWDENQLGVSVEKGRFNVILGSFTSFANVPFDVPYWLGITINGGAELLPRIAFASSPYSLNARDVSTNTIDSTKIKPAGISFSDLGQNGATSGQVPKWSGTAWQPQNDETGGTGTLSAGDSTFKADNNWITIGSNWPTYDGEHLAYLSRKYNTTGFRIGFGAHVENSSSGDLWAIQGIARSSSAASYAVGVSGGAISDAEYRYGVHCSANPATPLDVSGWGYGIKASADYGERAFGVNGVASHATTGYGIYGYAWGNGTNWAGYFSGNVNVTGTLTKGGGAFRIDHPLDPENKYLQHSFVESPDMKNIYDGNVVTDASGYVTVQLPEYFESLNRDFRYQLTVIGDFAQAIISEKIHNNRFTIRTDKPNVEVSWQVTGIRADRWAEKNRIQVEVDKQPSDRGKYSYPELYGQPAERGIDWPNTLGAEEKQAKRRSDSQTSGGSQ